MDSNIFNRTTVLENTEVLNILLMFMSKYILMKTVFLRSLSCTKSKREFSIVTIKYFFSNFKVSLVVYIFSVA